MSGDPSSEPVALERDEAEALALQGVEEEETGADSPEPFDPTQLRIEHRPLTVDLLVKRLRAGELELGGGERRPGSPWSDVAQSRLVESLLIRLPLPAFYLDATEEERWLVVDGLERLRALKRFVLDQELALTGLEFLPQLRGKRFGELPRPMQRRIEETQLVAYLVQPGTPPGLRFNLFKRINTGGPPRSPQELRHALNPGPAAELLERLAAAPALVRVVGPSLREQRMADRELVLRFLAFVLTPPEQYRSQDLDGFLHQQMGVLSGMGDADRAALEGRFLRAMEAAWRLFEQDAFRRRARPEEPRRPLNKALFEAWAVTLDSLDDAELERLVERREELRARLMGRVNQDSEFVESLSRSTGDVRNVRRRFTTVRELTREVLDAAAP